MHTTNRIEIENENSVACDEKQANRFCPFFMFEMSVFTHLVTDSAEFHIEYYNWKGIQTIIVCAFYGKVP